MLNRSIKEYVSSKYRLSIIFGITVLIIGGAYFITSSNETVNPFITSAVTTQKIKPSTSSEPPKPEMPIGYQSSHENRNPFALPPEYVLKPHQTPSVSSQTIRENVVTSSPVATTTDLPKEPISNLRLTGIITSDNIRIAVIQSANKSKQYQVNDSVGAYKVTAINDETVILDGSIGPKVLILEAATKKGGDKNAK